jgi:N-methylhydantoinase A
MRAENRVGIDIGGTFTDAVLARPGGSLTVAKVPTNPDDYADGFMGALSAAVDGAGIRAEEITYVAHGSTVATNALVESRLPRIGLITTVGFRDVLAIGTQQRNRLYDLHTPKPAPLVPRHLCLEVRERIGPSGEVLRPLEQSDVADAADAFAGEGVEAVAVCLLFSFLNDKHEREVAQILSERLPGVPVAISCHIAPEIREYPRASTTCVNAALLPIVGSYVRNVEKSLLERGVGVSPYLMRSNGGVTSVRAAAEIPAGLVASGPAAGVSAAAEIGHASGFQDLLSFDMGGTTADVSLVLGGVAQLRYRGTVHGHPLNLAQVDVLSIGAGGGSIASVDDFGALSVGPTSAGSNPGPAGYGLGGEFPTVTDAHIVLGAMDPGYFLGGRMSLDLGAAERAIRQRVAEPLGLSVNDAARAVLRVANATMAQGLRLISIERGHDPRNLALFAFGGAGPMHAASLADELGIRRVLVPRYPGVTSALGLLLSDARHDVGRTWVYETNAVPQRELSALLADLDIEGRELMRAAGFEENQIATSFEADMRYRGQAYDLTVPLERDKDAITIIARAEEAFHATHSRTYGHATPVRGVEITAIRLRATGRTRGIDLMGQDGARLAVQSPAKFGMVGGVTHAFIDRAEVVGAIAGPALIFQEDSTIVVPTGWTLAPGAAGTSVLERAQ